MSVNFDDKPITKLEDDLLGHNKFAEDIATLLATQPNGSNFIMSINGEWGSGKSSLIKMCKSLLEKEDENVKCLIFNGWLFENYDDAKTAILGEIPDALKENTKNSEKAVLHSPIQHTFSLIFSISSKSS